MDLADAFGHALREARKRSGLTQEAFSNVSSRTYLSTLERGLKSPTLEKLSEISGVMGIHPLTLLAMSFSYYENSDIRKVLEHVQRDAERLGLEGDAG